MAIKGHITPNGLPHKMLRWLEERAGFAPAAEWQTELQQVTPLQSTRGNLPARLLRDGYITITVEITPAGVEALAIANRKLKGQHDREQTRAHAL